MSVAGPGARAQGHRNAPQGNTHASGQSFTYKEAPRGLLSSIRNVNDLNAPQPGRRIHTGRARAPRPRRSSSLRGRRPEADTRLRWVRPAWTLQQPHLRVPVRCVLPRQPLSFLPAPCGLLAPKSIDGVLITQLHCSVQPQHRGQVPLQPVTSVAPATSQRHGHRACAPRDPSAHPGA